MIRVSDVVGAMRAINGRQVAGALLFALIVSAVNGLTFIQPIMQFAQTISPWILFVQALATDGIRALCLLVAIVAADRAVDRGSPRRPAYVMAAVAGCFVGILVTEPFNWAYRTYALDGLYPAHRAWLHGTPALFYHPIFQLTHWLLLGGAAVFLYANRRAARRTSRILHDAELDRIRRSKLALESRLRAMQARVEPQFLFNTLSQVEQLYEVDPPRGGRMLDDLIAYLHAAMPRMRDTSSTVAQEVELARAYLDIVRLRLGNRLDVSIDVPPGVGAARMPPMMMLPLIDHTVVRRLGATTGGGAVRIAAQVGGDRLRMSVVDSGAELAPDGDADGIDAIRQRLEALYRGDASLELRRGDASTEAVLDLPLERPAIVSASPDRSSS